MSTPATTQTPYRMNFRPIMGMRVSRRRMRWAPIASLVGFVLVAGATAVDVYMTPRFVSHCGRDDTKTSLRAFHAVAEAWRANHGNECPTPQRLKDDKELAASSSLVDAWGSPYLIGCNEDTTIAMSFGPDKIAGTTDDVVFPSTRPQ